MKKNSYIIGKSLCCNLGNTKEEITTNLLNLNSKNYKSFLEKNFEQMPFYKIHNFDYSPTKRFFELLKYVIDQSIKDARLTQVEIEELHIFIGSTSMGISLEEEVNKQYHKDESKDEFAHIGYGYIGTFVEKYINSKYKASIFSTACTSSVNALSYASKLIESNKIKKAIIIGIELFNESTYKGFSSLMLLSQNKIYRPYDKKSDGIILGEGCSAIILSAQQKNENNFKYISSSNICDNYSETTSDPSGKPIFNCLNESLKKAKLTLKDIDLIKAHATGSENNNSSEAQALKLLFGEYNTSTSITALKPYIGHTLGACGINEIILILYALNKNYFPATLGFNEPINELCFIPLKKHKKINNKVNILFNFVAFGGNNSSIILSNKS